MPARNDRKLLYIFAAVLSGTLVMSVLVICWLWGLNDNVLQVSGQVTKIDHTGELKDGILKQTDAMNRYIITGDPVYLEKYRQTARDNLLLEDRIREEIRGTRKPLAENIKDLNARYNEFCEGKIIPLIQGGQALPENLKEELFGFDTKLLESVSVIENMRTEDTLAITGTVVESSRRIARMGVIFTVAGLMAGAAAGIFAVRKLAAGNALLRAIFTTTRNAVVTTDARGNINSFNDVAGRIFGISPETALGRHFNSVFTGKRTGTTVNFTCPAFNEIMAGGRGRCNQEMCYTAADGWEMVLNMDCLPLGEKKRAGVMLMARDITERKAMEQRLYELTMRDTLTDLYNHGYLFKALKTGLGRSAEQNKPLAFIILDVDNFKYYNDHFGHPAGDGLLKEFSRVLLSSVRSGDIVGRYGGDEFGIILPDTGPLPAERIAERLRRKINAHPFPQKEEMPGGNLTASMGIAVFPYHGTTVHDIVKAADEAMYHVKRNCKGRVQLYFPFISDFQDRRCNPEFESLSVLDTLLTLMNAKDRHTFAHAEKVAGYCAIIARELQLPVEQAQVLEQAALLHDIGKLEIPSSILEKNGALDEGEWQIVKQHPVMGGQMLKSFPQLNSIIPCIVHHHERYDGGGYPRGLAGDEIPLCARIIAVADSFDAMISRRHYKESLPCREALVELEKNAGTQFDPFITEAFINSFKNIA